MKNTSKLLLCGLTALAVTGCGGSGGTPGPATGFLSLGLSDGPVHSADQVCIEFNGIEMKQAGGDNVLVEFDAGPEKVDLLHFQGANAYPLLVNHEMPAGSYEWMRLDITAERGGPGGNGASLGDDTCVGEGSYIVMDDGNVYNLYTPSGENNGLKLVSGYTVPTNDTVSLTLEFDIAKSITAPPGQSPDVLLRPTIRLVDNNEVGTLTGQVANALVEAEGCEASVYLFADGVTPNGIEDGVVDENDPIATAMVEAHEQDGLVEYHYTMGFLLAGDYEVAFTCDNQTFEPEEGKPATIVVDDVKTVDFEAPVVPQ